MSSKEWLRFHYKSRSHAYAMYLCLLNSSFIILLSLMEIAVLQNIYALNQHNFLHNTKTTIHSKVLQILHNYPTSQILLCIIKAQIVWNQKTCSKYTKQHILYSIHLWWEHQKDLMLPSRAILPMNLNMYASKSNEKIVGVLTKGCLRLSKMWCHKPRYWEVISSCLKSLKVYMGILSFTFL